MNANSTNNDRNEKSDNLQEIKGIGPDYERALQQLGVRKFAQLAMFEDAQQLHKALEKSGIEIIPETWRIEKFGWIEQANEKVPWKEHSSFIVTFDHYTDEGDGEEFWRTRVYKTENGYEPRFPGTDPSTWTQWIFEQANLISVETHVDEVFEAEESDPSETELVVTRVPEAGSGKRLNLVDVQVRDLSTAVSQRELMVRVNFELVGSEVARWIEERPAYRLELYLLDLERQVTEPVASTQKRLEPGLLEYEIGEAIPIPSPGRYELYVLLFSLPPSEIMVAHQGPIINVVPHPVSAF